MLNNKELKDFMPKAKCNWEEDKDKFIKLQKRLEEGIGDINVQL